MAEEQPAEAKGKRKPNPALLKPVQPDEKLAAVVGKDPLPRSQIISRLWEYIRSHNLQDPANKQFIKADDKLKEVFDGKDRVSMFEMTKLVSKHVT
jgi:upstream activation factor subunit UAF30